MKSFTFHRYFLLLVFLTAGNLKAQWEIVAPGLLGPPTTYYGVFGNIEFKDGVLWAGAMTLWKSLDTGRTWTRVDEWWDVRDMQFYNNQIGAVATGTGGVLLTKDQGRTWTNILDIGYPNSVCFGDHPNEILVTYHGGGFMITRDGGATWSQEHPGVAIPHAIRLGKSHIAMLKADVRDGSHAVSVSTNFGATWRQTLEQPLGVDLDSWSFCVDSCDRNRLYVANEEALLVNNGFAEIYVSTNLGATWQPTFSRPSNYLTGAIVSGPHTVYAGTSHDGIVRTTDKGETWEHIGGPSSIFDCRSIAVINDSIVLGVDSIGNIWRTMNSGGVPMDLSNAYSLAVAQPTLFQGDTARTCDEVLVRKATLHPSCNPKIVSQRIVGPDADAYQIIRSAPNTISTEDSILLSFTPTGGKEHNATLLITLENGKELEIPLAATGITPTSVSLARIVSVNNDTIGATIRVPIILHKSEPIPSLSLSVHYDTAMLVYQGSTATDGTVLDLPNAQWPGRSRLSIPQNVLNSNDTIIGYAEFTLFPQYDSCSMVVFDSLSLGPNNNCISIAEPSSMMAEVCSGLGCGTVTLSRFMRYGAYDRLFVHPNPAEHTVTISANKNLGDAQLEIVDVRGNIVSTKQATLGLNNAVIFSVDHLAKGKYLIKATTESSTLTTSFVRQ